MGKLKICLASSIWLIFDIVISQLYVLTWRFFLYFCVCSWNLAGPENYALQYADGVQMYITESVSHNSTQISMNIFMYLWIDVENIVKTFSKQIWVSSADYFEIFKMIFKTAAQQGVS